MRIAIVAYSIVAGVVFGVLPHAFSAAESGCRNPATPCRAPRIITFYVPCGRCGLHSMEGPIATSKPGLDGLRIPRSLDDVRAGRVRYVTVATDPSMNGNYYNIGTVTYRSALDNQMHTVQNVVGYSHDTGGAFKGRPDKIDVNTTICQQCTDKQASALAAGKNVSIIPSNEGLIDPNSDLAKSGFGNVLTGSPAPGAGVAPSPGAGGAGQPQIQPQNGTGTGFYQNLPEKNMLDASKKKLEDLVQGMGDGGKASTDGFIPPLIDCDRGKVTWRCSSPATISRGLASPADAFFKTRGALVGSVGVRPIKKTIYTIQCLRNQNIVEEASCALTPTAKTKTSTSASMALSISVEPEILKRGKRAMITWSSIGASSCSIGGQGFSDDGLQGEGATEIFLKRGTYTYTVTCRGKQGNSKKQQATVVVQ